MARRSVKFRFWLCVSTGILWATAGWASGGVPAGYRTVAAEYGVPASILYAVALAESGTVVDAIRKIRPWPWTLNVSGQGRFFPSRQAASAALQVELADGRESVDIGLMQINWRYHKARLVSPTRALDPYHNLRVAAEILRDCYQRRGDWWEAVGCYHAPSNTRHAARYQRRVRRHWQRVAASTKGKA